MTKYTATIKVTYDFKGKLLNEYLEWLDDYRDTKQQRDWFIIDRFVGHHNLRFFDKKAKVTVTKEKK